MCSPIHKPNKITISYPPTQKQQLVENRSYLTEIGNIINDHHSVSNKPARNRILS